MFEPPFRPGQIVGNNDLTAAFHCACEGGIRPANATNSIALVLNHTLHSHETDWRGDILHFRGAGAKGDQTLEKGRNRSLLKAFAAGRPVYLFEVYKPKQYTFRGRVELAGEPYASKSPDSGGIMRRAWIFPLKLAKNESAAAFSEDVYDEK